MTTIPVLGDGGAGPWFRVVSLTAARPAGPAEQDFAAILPAALATAARDRPFVAGWLSRGAGSPLELITNAAASQPAQPPPGGPHPAGQPLLYPPGSRGVPAGAGWLAAWDSLVWVLCPARQAPPLAGPGAPQVRREPPQPTLFESALAALAGRPFGWLVVAEPTGLLDTEIAELRTQVNVLRRHDEEQSRFGAERTERRLAELDAFAEAGLWDVRVIAGAATGTEAAQLAPVLVGSVDVSHHPYRLVTGRVPYRLAEALRARTADPPGTAGPAATAGPAETAGPAGTADPPGAARAPFPATAGVLAALTGLPSLEVPGLRVVDAGHFDLTSETGEAGPAGQAADALHLGMIIDGLDRPVGDFGVPLATLNRHALVTGATGAGKSQTVRHLLEQLARAGLPWLVIEPVKSEYPAVAGRLAAAGAGRGQDAAAVTVINPADPAAIPFSVNPLAPEPGYPVQAHIDMVRALFLAAFDADEPFPQIMSQALQRVYSDCGWDVVTGGRVPGAAAPPVIPTLAQLQRTALAVIEEVGYGAQLQADVRGFVDVRLRSLRIGSAGRFFEGGHPGDVAALLGRNVVLAIEDVANDEDKAFLMGTLIIRIVEHLRLRARAGQREELRHVIVIEEAHRLLRAGREGRASAHAVELFASMLAEIRAYGEGLVIAEQIPAKLVPDAVKNTALKVVHRLPARDDRDLVGAAMNLDEDQSRQVVSLPPGVAAVFADGMDRPVRLRVPFGGDRERVLPGPPPPLAARRSPACGPVCTGRRACTLLDMRRAELLAAPGPPGEPGEPSQAWLRLWAETLVLAFLTGNGLPAPPGPLRRWWPGLERRLRECLLATVLDRSVRSRALAVRASYDPAALAAAAGGAALRMLEQGPGAGVRPGPRWVIPQVRWLHEMERMCPLAGRSPDPAGRAPPPDYDLPGLAGWPGMRMGHRLRALRRHPLSTELPPNRLLAWTVLLGEDDQAGFMQDLATVGVGLGPGARLRQAAGAMGAADGWLEVVLSWPRRFVAPPST
ncbi:MAG TPA: ATP-binding protein [Streptosporangiaceae bacterium]|nr:ATP-binding protein [Streptosporangiaceae bacterium]